MIRLLLVPLIPFIGVLAVAEDRRGPIEPAFKIVVHASNPTNDLSAETISSIFLKKVTRWQSRQVVPVDQTAASPTRAAFSKEVLRKSVPTVKSYWQRMIFSGRLLPPHECKTDSEVLEYVQNNVDAIGYVSANTPLGAGVKTVELRFDGQ